MGWRLPSLSLPRLFLRPPLRLQSSDPTSPPSVQCVFYSSLIHYPPKIPHGTLLQAPIIFPLSFRSLCLSIPILSLLLPFPTLASYGTCGCSFQSGSLPRAFFSRSFRSHLFLRFHQSKGELPTLCIPSVRPMRSKSEVRLTHRRVWTRRPILPRLVRSSFTLGRVGHSLFFSRPSLSRVKACPGAPRSEGAMLRGPVFFRAS